MGVKRKTRNPEAKRNFCEKGKSLNADYRWNAASQALSQKAAVKPKISFGFNYENLPLAKLRAGYVSQNNT